MVFQHFEPKSFKNHRFFNGFGVGPGPDPARARPRPGTGLGGAEPGLGGSPGMTWLSQASQETVLVLALGAALCAASTVERWRELLWHRPLGHDMRTLEVEVGGGYGECE